MGIIASGSTSQLGRPLLEVDPTFTAIKASFRPPEALGAFRMKLQSGTISAAAGAGIVYAFQYAGSGVALILNVTLGIIAIAGNTAGSQLFSLWATRSYTVLDVTNAGTVATQKGQALAAYAGYQMQSNIAIVGVGSGMLSGGTGTDDAQAMASLVAAIPGSISPILLPVPFFPTFNGIGYPVHPLTLAQNEGFRIRADTAFPGGTDTSQLFISTEWIEAAAF